MPSEEFEVVRKLEGDRWLLWMPGSQHSVPEDMLNAEHGYTPAVTDG